MNRVEILAPAGSIEGLKAAVNVGCDAVYIGGAKFGARAYANNLDEETLLKAIDYTHIRGKQLYLTVNTLLKNEELNDELYHYLKRFYLQGLDAVIVQDVGVMHYIHEHFPQLPIHASTQMTLTMAEGVNELKKYGVTRIVPARELSLLEIQRIRRSTDMEIEAFVHGALCYSYSGQCFMSSMIGGRSGNRGRCAQPCRMEYQVEEAKKVVSERDQSYMLSPKDMCTLSMVAQMIEAGIDSFKIEGRMKRPEYAAGVVLAYKKQTDMYYELGAKGYDQYHKEHPEVMAKEIQKLQDLYNRGGFSTGYYDMHNSKEMMSMHRPNHSGVLVGHVVNRQGIQAEIALCEDVNAQDILEFRHQGEATYEFTVKDSLKKGSKLRTNTKPNSKIERNDEVYRTKNSLLLENLANRFMNVDEKIKICGELIAVVGQPLQLTLWTTLPMVVPGTNVKKESITIEVTELGDIVSEALKQPMVAANVEEKLKKTKETPFEFEHLTVNLKGNVFFPIGKLNELRRTALSNLELRMASKYRRSEQVLKHNLPKKSNNQSHATKDLVMIAVVKDEMQIAAVCKNTKVSEVYVDIAENSFESLHQFAETIKRAGKKVFYLLPHILRASSYDELTSYQEYFKDDLIDGFVLKNFEELSFCNNILKTKKELRLDYNMYVMNEEAVKFYEEIGIHHYTSSIELNATELKTLPLWKFDLVVYGYLPLMISAQCVRKNTTECRLFEGKENAYHIKSAKPLLLIDRVQMKLPVRTNCHYCYNSIYNSQCISLLGNAKEIKKMDLNGIRLDFTMEDEAQVTTILKNFEDAFYNDKEVAFDSSLYSKGHFKRGIL